MARRNAEGEETLERAEYVYRRIAPPLYKIKRNEVAPDAFTLREADKSGLSVYRADKSSPYDVLFARIEEARAQLQSDGPVRARAQRFLENNPTVEALVDQSQYRVVEIPIAEIRRMGFSLGAPDEKGHLNIHGTHEQFEEHKLDFTELIATGKSRILSAEECIDR